MCPVHNFMDEGVHLKDFLSSMKRLGWKITNEPPYHSMIEIFSFLPFFLFASHIPYIPFSRGIVCTLPLSPQNAHSTENATVCNASVWSPFPNSEHTKSSRPLTAGTQKKLREQCKRKQRRPTQYKSKTSAPPESGDTY